MIALCAVYGMGAQITTRDQHSLADSSINNSAVAYQTCGARMFYQHSALQHDGMMGWDTCALSTVDYRRR